jgi:glucose/arabinose dehydrogenase
MRVIFPLMLISLMLISLMLTSLILLSACGFGGGGEPPLPTIVPITPTGITSSPPTIQPPSPTPTQPSMGDTIETGPSHTPPIAETTEPPSAETPTPPESPTPLPPEMPAVPPLGSLTPRLLPVASGFNKPTFLTHTGDGSRRLFVTEQPGRILVIKDGNVLPTPFLGIVSIVGSDGSEQGLLSVVFHPNYTSNGFFFVNYTNKQGDTTIARYQVSDNPDVADPNSARILLTINQPYVNHNGGQLVFGPDGYLYVGMGDGGAANDPHDNGQNLNTLLGKILRLDVDNADPYGVPQNNPFVNQSDARPEIWSYGWRNPWRFSFDQATGDMYIADVGQNQYEEVDVELAGTSGGQNYGWRLMEGLHCFNPQNCDPASLDVVLPVVEYDHSQGCSVTGGYVYRGSDFPDLTDVYFYGDYCSGIIWGLRREADGNWAQAQLLQAKANISSFGQDETGEVYVVDHRGDIFQIGN